MWQCQLCCKVVGVEPPEFFKFIYKYKPKHVFSLYVLCMHMQWRSKGISWTKPDRNFRFFFCTRSKFFQKIHPPHLKFWSRYATEQCYYSIPWTIYLLKWSIWCTANGDNYYSTVDHKRDVISLLWPTCDFYCLSSRRTPLPFFFFTVVTATLSISGIFSESDILTQLLSLPVNHLLSQNVNLANRL